MTSDEIVYNTITDEARLPGARMMWGPQPPLPPYFTYGERPGSMFADSENIPGVPKYSATLYEDEHDEQVEARFERAIGKLGTWTRHATEREGDLLSTRYDFSLVRRADS